MSPRRAIVLAGTLAAAAAVAGVAVVGATRSMRAGETSAVVATAGEPGVDDALQGRLAASEAEVRRLAGELEATRGEYAELADEVAGLRDDIAHLQARRAATSHAAGDESRRARRARAGADAQAAEPGPRPLDVGALVAAGFPEETVRSFKESVDQIELDRLYLRDLAAREGWLGTPKFREASRALEHDMQSTREDYGEDFYDWMLYTTGHPNRVRVDAVIGGSAAADVGLQPGDVIVSYGGERVFTPQELRDATTTGEAGESTPVEVVRDGRPARVVVPRGPLGVRVEPAAVEPPRAG